MNKIVLIGIGACIALVSLSGCDSIPAWRQMQAEAIAKANITNQQAEGQAQFQKAESERRVQVLNAQALLDSASLTAQAEVQKARGVSQANQIMSQSLGGPEGYLRWKYIEMLQENHNSSTIYIPTEAGLPILEAGKR